MLIESLSHVPAAEWSTDFQILQSAPIPVVRSASLNITAQHYSPSHLGQETGQFAGLHQIMESSPSSAESVFSVAELCEAILLHADVADVLRCRRVSRTFYNTFAKSKPIRQKMFLQPDSESERVVCPLAPAFFRQQMNGYRDSTIAVRVDMVDLWANAEVEVEPLWRGMLISQPPTTTCVIPIENHSLTIYFRRSYPKGRLLELSIFLDLC